MGGDSLQGKNAEEEGVRKVEGPPNGLSDGGAAPEAVRQAALRTNVLESKTKRGQARGCIPRAVRVSVSQTR